MSIRNTVQFRATGCFVIASNEPDDAMEALKKLKELEKMMNEFGACSVKNGKVAPFKLTAQLKPKRIENLDEFLAARDEDGEEDAGDETDGELQKSEAAE